MQQHLKCSFTFFQVFRSIGYRSVAIDNDIPFDDKNGVVSCESNDGHVAGLPGIRSVFTFYSLDFLCLLQKHCIRQGRRKGGAQGGLAPLPFLQGGRGGGQKGPFIKHTL